MSRADADAPESPQPEEDADVDAAEVAFDEPTGGAGESQAALPIRMLHDRVLVDPDDEQGERRSSGGILIPATVQMGRKLAWAKVVAIGSNVRSVRLGDRVLFDPQERAEVELRNKTYLLLRERDLHAVAAERLQDSGTGLYL
ncbi:co-chaperone GroES [Brooklawnia cerclae]|uniref:10 kDa chaperonin n=2 Tax=Brooklawnia cerclae TaxID=349934 RepID=A0ABX0SCC7_9ACTN|nr:chaperonin GroES [Brooklawnia cerclae]